MGRFVDKLPEIKYMSETEVMLYLIYCSNIKKKWKD